MVLRRFRKMAKPTICFVMSVRPNGTTGLPLDGFSWNFVFKDFSKIHQEKSSPIKISQECVLYMKTYVNLCIAEFF